MAIDVHAAHVREPALTDMVDMVVGGTDVAHKGVAVAPGPAGGDARVLRGSFLGGCEAPFLLAQPTD